MEGTLSRYPIVTELANCFQNNENTSLSTPTPTPSSLSPLSLMIVNNNEEFMTLVSLIVLHCLIVLNCNVILFSRAANF